MPAAQVGTNFVTSILHVCMFVCFHVCMLGCWVVWLFGVWEQKAQQDDDAGMVGKEVGSFLGIGAFGVVPGIQVCVRNWSVGPPCLLTDGRVALTVVEKQVSGKDDEADRPRIRFQ